MKENEKLNMQMSEKNALLEPLKKLNLMDDFLFDVTTVNLEACRIIIELSLNIRIREIRWKEGQKVVHNLPEALEEEPEVIQKLIEQLENQ